MAKTVAKVQKRTDALTQLKRAQMMLAEGNKNLAAAQAQIDQAQELIDESASVLRSGWAGADQVPTRSSRVRGR